MCLQAMVFQGVPGAHLEGFSPSLQRETGSAAILILDFEPPELWENLFCGLGEFATAALGNWYIQKMAHTLIFDKYT